VVVDASKLVLMVHIHEIVAEGVVVVVFDSTWGKLEGNDVCGRSKKCFAVMRDPFRRGAWSPEPHQRRRDWPRPNLHN
jgi:hypothetical protein